MLKRLRYIFFVLIAFCSTAKATELVKINEKYHIDLAFEGGEAETLAVDGPIFKKRLKILRDKKIWNRDSGVYIIEKAVLEDK